MARPAAVPHALLLEVTRRAQDLITRKLEPLLAREKDVRKSGFNYAVAVFSEWRGRSFYLCARYRTPKPVEEFVVRTARLAYAGAKHFDLSYFRYTGRWQPIYVGLTVDKCFEVIEQEKIFWPIS